MIRVSAPGKLMIAGEYAVLHGHHALVAAVDRRVRLTLSADGSRGDRDDSPDSCPLPPEALLAREVAERRLGPVPGTMNLDVMSRRSEQGDQKLGLGSSAAAASAAACAIHAAHGLDLGLVETRRQILEDAMEGHRRVAPNGSGADVAAATLGGFVSFRRDRDTYEASAARLPEDVVVRVVWTGREARTSELVARVRALRERDEPAHDAAIERIGAAAKALSDAAAGGDTAGVIEAAEAHGSAMADLGVRSGAPIVDETLDRIMNLAAEAGGAAKPSGAGGGDVAIAFFQDSNAARSFEEACAGNDLALLCLDLGGEGVTIDPQPQES